MPRVIVSYFLCTAGNVLSSPERRTANRRFVEAAGRKLLKRLPFRAAIASVCSLLLIIGASGCGGSVPAPKAFAKYDSPDGRFACDYPQGWEKAGGGKADKPISWAKFTSGNAEIRVDADFAGSLFGDIAKAGSAMSGDEEPPAAKVHPLGKRHMKEEFGDKYEEREPKPFQSKGFGEGRRSVFIAPSSFGGKTFGYRATLLSGERRLTVITMCPAANWQILKPAFEKVIASLRQGGS
jgi:hypothetical protein